MLHIITHPLIGNYGGILQAFALQSSIKEMGLKVKVCEEIPSFAQADYHSPGKRIKWQQFKAALNLVLGRMPCVPPFLKRKRAKSFKACFMEMGDRRDVGQRDAFIVGSDQVWRPEYTRTYSGVEYYFLSFATEEQRSRSIAYAASFGRDEWEGTPDETAVCRELLKGFKAVSVREESGVGLCRDIFGVQAIQLPDPTLLLNAEKYSSVIDKSRTWEVKERFMADYVLDSAPEIQRMLQETAQRQGFYRQHLMPHAHARKLRDRFPMSVPQWLRCIRECEFLVTDSFHGCVFSIIFNKPFVCLGNAERGSSRFDTLLKTFGLQNRLLEEHNPQAVETLVSSPIDWETVNVKIAEERQRGLQFLQQYLPEQ